MASTTNSPFQSSFLKWFPVILGIVAHTVTVVWWAATLNSGQKDLEEDMGMLVQSIKEIQVEQKNRTGLVYSVEGIEKDLGRLENRLLALEQRYQGGVKP